MKTHEPTDNIKIRCQDMEFDGKDWREKENKFREKTKSFVWKNFSTNPQKPPSRLTLQPCPQNVAFDNMSFLNNN